MSEDTAPGAVEANPQEVTEQEAPEQDKAQSAIDALAKELTGNDEDGEEPAGDTPAETVEPEKKAEPDVKVKIGDDELTIDELKNGYLRDKDYRQKTQALAEQRRETEAYQAHLDRLKADPAYFEHVFRGYQPKPAEAPKPPDDPIEALKWEMKQEVIKELAPQFQQLQAKQTIDAVKAQVMRDPLFDETQAAIIGYVKGLPEDEQALTYRLLDSNPAAYQKRYAHAREWVVSQKAEKAKGETATKAEEQEPVARKERAPLLEQSGRTVPTASEESEKAKERKRLYNKVKSGGASNDDLADYLMTMPGFSKLL